jgi:hypothetical protein
MIAYRICERKDEKLLTLFHGLNGTRTLPVGEWLKADVKLVCDGTRKTSTEYMSGFHLLPTMDECRDFARKFTKERDLVMVECEVKGIRRKEHSPSNVLLVDNMKLIRVVEKLPIKKKKQ